MLYEKVLKSIKEAKTATSHITALGKIRAITEDQILLNKIDAVIALLSIVRKKPGKPGQFCLDKSTLRDLRDTKALVDYCQKHVINQKPEWQVMAERKGWAPKK